MKAKGKEEDDCGWVVVKATADSTKDYQTSSHSGSLPPDFIFHFQNIMMNSGCGDVRSQ